MPCHRTTTLQPSDQITRYLIRLTTVQVQVLGSPLQGQGQAREFITLGVSCHLRKESVRTAVSFAFAPTPVAPKGVSKRFRHQTTHVELGELMQIPMLYVPPPISQPFVSVFATLGPEGQTSFPDCTAGVEVECGRRFQPLSLPCPISGWLRPHHILYSTSAAFLGFSGPRGAW